MKEMPMIGVIPLWDQGRQSLWMCPGYFQGLLEAGLLPVMLPLTEDEEVLSDAARRCAGFLFTGGQDVNPGVYGEARTELCGEICERRDGMETFLFRQAVEGEGGEKKPALGICRGIQFINAVLGGTLYQDLPRQLGEKVSHAQRPPYDKPVHQVTLYPGTPLQKLAGEGSLGVNSCHHQGIKALAPGLLPMAASEDGLVEAVYLPGHPFLWAFQWHPEFAPAWESSRRIFQAFAAACRSGTAGANSL